MDLTRVDPDNGSYRLQVSPDILAVNLSMICTVLFVHLFDLEKEHSAFDHIIVKLVEAGYGGEPGPRNLAERMEIETVDGLNNEIDDCPAEGEWQKRGPQHYASGSLRRKEFYIQTDNERTQKLGHGRILRMNLQRR